MASSRTAGGADDEPVKGKYDLVDATTLYCPICRGPGLAPPVIQNSSGCFSCSQFIKLIQIVPRKMVLWALGVSCEPSGALKACNLEMEKHDTLCKYGSYHCPVTNCCHDTLLDKMFDHNADIHENPTLTIGVLWDSILLDPLDRVAKFSMRKSEKKFMIIDTEYEALSVLVHCSKVKDNPGLVSFICTTLGPKELFYNLKVTEARDGHSASYFLEALAPSLQRKGEPSCKREYLAIPTILKAMKPWCLTWNYVFHLFLWWTWGLKGLIE